MELTLAQRVLLRKEPMKNHDQLRPDLCYCLKCRCSLLITWYSAAELGVAANEQHAWASTTRNFFILSPVLANGERKTLAML